MGNELTTLALGAGFNLIVALLIVRGIYYPVTQNKGYIFSFLAFNTVIYFVLGLLSSVELSMGVGFGLFAIFSVLRYRTDEMPIREMTYLFTIIALPVMNSVLMPSGEIAKLLIANAMVVALLYVLEREWGFHFEARKLITYDRIDLIAPEKTERMLANLRERTGLPVKRAEVGTIDLLRDVAQITIFYDEPTTRRSIAGQTRSDKRGAAHSQPVIETS